MDCAAIQKGRFRKIRPVLDFAFGTDLLNETGRGLHRRACAAYAGTDFIIAARWFAAMPGGKISTFAAARVTHTQFSLQTFRCRIFLFAPRMAQTCATYSALPLGYRAR